MQPLRRYALDSAILFSDIWVVADMFNMNLRFEDKIGPIFDEPLRTESDFEKLPSELDVSNLEYVNETIKNIKYGKGHNEDRCKRIQTISYKGL